MTEETTQTTTPSQPFAHAIGARLKSAREALGMDKKDVAAQLRLNENVITMLEKDEYPNSLPTIFIRGYIRSYGKFLDLPDYEIKEALTPIQPPVKEAPKAEEKKPTLPALNKNVIMKSVNIVITLTLVSLVWLWWHNHNTASVQQTEKNLAIPFDTGAPDAAQTSANTLVIQEPIHTGNSASNSQSIKIPLAPQVNHALSEAAIKPAANTPAPEAKPVVVNAPPAKKANDDEDDYDDVE